MSVRRAVAVIGMMAFGLVTAAVPAVASSATSSSGIQGALTQDAAGPGVELSSSTTCRDLGKEQAQSSKFATTLEQALASGNFTTIKKAVLSEFAEVTKAITAAKNHLGSPPANVKAALTTVQSAFTQLEASVRSSTSLSQLETAFESFGQNAKLKSAGMVLANYYGHKCGVTTPTT
jgi:hypothetical protein